MSNQTGQSMEDVVLAAQPPSSSDTTPIVHNTSTLEPRDPPNRLSSNTSSQTTGFSPRASSEPTGSRRPKRILLMGLTGAGKSTFINRVTGSTLAVSTSLASCTQQVATVQLELEDGTLVELVDTPGFNDSLRPDIEILEEIAKTLKSWDEEDPNIHGIIYIHRISDVRMSGSSRKSFSVFYNICGEEAMPHVSIVTNMWDTITLEQGQAREAELLQDPLFFKKAIDSKARIFQNASPPDSTLKILHEAICPIPVRLLIQKELSDGKKDLLQTAAGTELDQEMAETRAQHEAELLKINQEYTRAQQEQDDETLAELEEERENIRQKMDGMQALVDRLQERKAASVPRQEEYAVARGPSYCDSMIQPVREGESGRRTVDCGPIDRKPAGRELVTWARGQFQAPARFYRSIKGVATEAFKACLGRDQSRGWGEMAEEAAHLSKLVHEVLPQQSVARISGATSSRFIEAARRGEPAAEERTQESTVRHRPLTQPSPAYMPITQPQETHGDPGGRGHPHQ